MMIDRIYSNRTFERWPSWHLVHEWEEDLAHYFNIPLVSSYSRTLFLDNKISRNILSAKPVLDIAQTADRYFSRKVKSLVFEPAPKHHFSFTASTNSIPLLIDVWKGFDVKEFERVYRNCPLVGISSKELLQFLVGKRVSLPLVHTPLSLSDRYRLSEGASYEKKYDVLLAGRRNAVLWEYIHIFAGKFPEVEFIYQENVGGRLNYVSNKRGTLGEFQSRAQYVGLLRSSRVALYATPGIDGGEDRTGGFNPVTPRFLELLAAGCHVLGRYPDNPDTRFYRLEEILPNIREYDQFEELMLRYLSGERPDLHLYRKYLENHYTSRRAEELKTILTERN